MLTTAVLFFFFVIHKYAQTQTNINIELFHLDYNNVEVGQPANRAGNDGESSLAQFHMVKNFLANEIFNFSRMFH